MNKAFDDFLWENYPSTNTPLGKRLLNKVNSALRIIDERVMQLFNIEIPTIKNTKLDVTEAYKLVKGISLDEDTGIFTITFYDNTQKEVDLSALITQYEFLDSDTIYFDLSKKEEKAFEMEWSRKELLHLYSGNSMTQKTYQSITVESELPITEITAKYVKPNESDFVSAQIKDISGDSKMFFVDFPGGGWKWTISLKTDSDIGDGTKKVIGYYKKIGCVTAHIKEGSIEEKHLRPDYLADIKVEAAKADSSRDSAAEKAQESAESALMSKSYSDGTSGIREGEEMDNAKYYSEEAKRYYDGLEQSGVVTGVKGAAEADYHTGDVNITPASIGLENVDNTADASKQVAGSKALKGWGDTRDVATTPNDYNNTFKCVGIKTPSACGLSDGSPYYTLFGVRGYENHTGGQALEIAVSGSKGKLYFRTGSTTTWGSWKTLADLTSTVSSANTLASTRTIFGKNFNGSQNVEGQGLFYGVHTDTPSSRYRYGGIQITENERVGNTNKDIKYAPSIGFHWSNVIAASLAMDSSGVFRFLKQDGVTPATVEARVTQDGNGNNIADTYAKKRIHGDFYISMGRASESYVGYNSCAIGKETIASGSYSHSEGNNTTASGDVSHAEGVSTTASGNYSHAEGNQTKTTTFACHAEGYKTNAENIASHASGKYNKAMVKNGSVNYQIGDAFVIGNGTGDSNLSNALRVTYAGDVLGTKAYQSSGADYAEFVKPWSDRNPEGEDRIGYFVTIKDGLLYKANAGDYIIGITSGNPSVVGNADEDYYWRYERDKFNRIVMEDAPELVQKTDEDGNPMFDEETHEPIMIETGNIIPNARMKISENYDPSLQESYIPRSERKEWDYVGMRGIIPVRDDGTCLQDHFCKCGKDGIATLAEERSFDTFYVIERISENIVSVEV